MDDKAKRAMQQQVLQTELDQLLVRAKNNGFAITVETRPQLPLAMGNYVLVGEVREWPAAQKGD